MSVIGIGFSKLKNILKFKHQQRIKAICLHEKRNYNSTLKAKWNFIDLTPAEYERVCSETLEGLSDYFEKLVESASDLASTDVIYNDGVLTVNLGYNGTYVINRQIPNKQIWLSSPKSGPKRYDFFGAEDVQMGEWIYKHTGESMHSLLQKEVKNILGKEINFFQLPYAGQ